MQRHFLWLIAFTLSGCAVTLPVNKTYKLQDYSQKVFSTQASQNSIFINLPETVASYQSTDMLYQNYPYQVASFSKNAWIDPPATMLLPLIIQSLAKSNYFYAVISSPNYESTTYRLDTQLLRLEQNFLVKPSRLELNVKASIIKTSNNKILASKLFNYQITCDKDTPYAGVAAANKATFVFTQELTQFIINQIKRNT